MSVHPSPLSSRKPEAPNFFSQIGDGAAQLQKQLQDGVGQSVGALESGWKATANAFSQLPALAGPLFSGVKPPAVHAEATAIARDDQPA